MKCSKRKNLLQMQKYRFEQYKLFEKAMKKDPYFFSKIKGFKGIKFLPVYFHERLYVKGLNLRLYVKVCPDLFNPEDPIPKFSFEVEGAIPYNHFITYNDLFFILDTSISHIRTILLQDGFPLYPASMDEGGMKFSYLTLIQLFSVKYEDRWCRTFIFPTEGADNLKLTNEIYSDYSNSLQRRFKIFVNNPLHFRRFKIRIIESSAQF